MKILELRFKNLNSLYGEWHIDFTDPEYAYNGIFALTGPTGSGKSTILDAICLALYGSTPRLGRITQSSNDIMSRQTGECFAEVVFASQAGRYRCHWAHHRSRKKADGELQSPRHEIAEFDGEKKVLENKLTSVLIAVEEKTGMDFDRFTRSILLAQGGFDTFLKATVEQKSKILEQITGTKIYSDISIGVHERLRDEKTNLSSLEAETRGILILSQEEELALEGALAQAQQEENKLRNSVTDLTKAIAWLTGIGQLQKEIKDLDEEETRLEADMLVFAPKRIILEHATKAATLEGVHATLSELRKQQKEDQASLTREMDALPALETQANAGFQTLANAEEQTQQAKKAQQDGAPIIKAVRALDQKIAQIAASIDESTTSIAKDVASIGVCTTKREAEEKKEREQQKKLSDIHTYCAEHAHDRALVTDLTGIVGQIQALETKQREIAKKEEEKIRGTKALEVAEKALATCKGKSDALVKKHTALTSELQAKREELSTLLGGKLLREYRTEKEALLREMVYLHKIVELEEYRLKLEDGKACPLCGALEHPFALGNVPVPDELEDTITALTKIITDAEDLETGLEALASQERDASTALSDQKQQESAAVHAKESAQTSYDTHVSALKEAQQLFAEMKEALLQKLIPYGISEVPDDLSLLIDSLQARRDAWQTKEKEQKSVEENIGTIKGELQRLEGIIATHEGALLEKKEILKALGASFGNAKVARHELYEDKDPDSEEDKLAKAIKEAEAKEKEARVASADLSQQVSTSKTKIGSLESSLSNRKPQLQAKEDLFLEKLSSIGFSDEQQFLSFRLPIAERNRLAQEAKTLDDRQTALKTSRSDRTARLDNEQAKAITIKPLGELQLTFVSNETELKEVRDVVAEYKAKIKANIEAKGRIESKQESLGKQKKEVEKWEKLHTLIGSADGKKFRNFAQGLTFELMVGHANKQLAKMSDRYLLIRSDDQPLELNVIDNYQAGEVRSTKNLSGGESFIVSLTLALGLSKMASRKVRVDSLFLDEGFGTLDEASLETALKTLSSLQQDGKLIGVISHVSAMQEMISTQITITPSSGGRSFLSGPGCRRVETGD